MNKTAIISSDTSINHLTGDGHPEQPKRVLAITERLKKNKNLIWDKPATFDHNILKFRYKTYFQPDNGFNII